MKLIERVKFKNADENSLSIYKDSRGSFWVETNGSGTYAVEFISLKDARAYLLSESAQYEHKHEPVVGVETYPYAKIGKCACGVDMVSYAAEIAAAHNWNKWEVTALGDPCLSCGGYDTPTCCEREE